MEQMQKVLAMVQENHLTEAQQTLDTMIQQTPDTLAQWFVLARLLLSEDEKRQQAILQALAGPDKRPQRRDFRRSVAFLEGQEDPTAASEAELEKLGAFLTTIRSPSPDGGETTPGGEATRHATGVARLHHLAQRLQARQCALKSRSMARTVSKLNQWAERMVRLRPKQPVAHPVIDRLRRLPKEVLCVPSPPTP